MLAAAATPIIVQPEHAPIHWEAVLITAVPAFFACVAAIATAALGLRTKAKVEQEIAPRLASVDRAVNGVADPSLPTLRENVAALAEHTLTPEQRPEPSTAESRAAESEATAESRAAESEASP
jgi:hypothetical protein